MLRVQIKGPPYEIFSTRQEHLDNGWRPTTVDVPAASGDGSTPQWAPTPFTMGAVLVQALVLLKDVSDRSERARPRMDYAVP